MTYIGFWRRVLGSIVDSIILGLALSILYALVLVRFLDFNASYWLCILIGIIYNVGFESSKYQATPGKMAIGAKVVDYNGLRISPPRAFLRYVGKIISGLALTIGFIMVAFTSRKQGLHDFIAKTLIVKV